MSFLTLFWGALPLGCSGQGASIHNSPKLGLQVWATMPAFFFLNMRTRASLQVLILAQQLTRMRRKAFLTRRPLAPRCVPSHPQVHCTCAALQEL